MLTFLQKCVPISLGRHWSCCFSAALGRHGLALRARRAAGRVGTGIAGRGFVKLDKLNGVIHAVAQVCIICELCDRPINKRRRYPDPLSLSKDHIRQKCVGGSDSAENLRPVHLVCNQRRERLFRLKGIAERRELPGYQLVVNAPSYLYYLPM